MSFPTHRHRQPSPTPDIILRDAADRIMKEALAPSRLFQQPFAFPPLSLRSMAPDIVADLLPDIDVSETDAYVEVVADVPGYDPKNVKAEIKDNCLVIRGAMEEEQEERGRRWHRHERHSGAFYREIPLPAVDEAKAACTLRNGTLTVTIPKKEGTHTKNIPIEIAS